MENQTAKRYYHRWAHDVQNFSRRKSMNFFYCMFMVFALSSCANTSTKFIEKPWKIVDAKIKLKASEEILQKADLETLVIFNLDSLFIGNDAVANLSETVNELQKKGIKTLLVADAFPLYRSNDIIKLINDHGYHFEKSWELLEKEYSFSVSGNNNGPIFKEGCLFFDKNAEVDYWWGIELFMIYARINAKNIILVHESGIDSEKFRCRRLALRFPSVEYISTGF
jgi:hypothetical protein